LIVRSSDFDPALARELKLTLMVPEECHAGAVRPQYLRHKQAQLPVSEHRTALPFGYPHLVQDLARRGQRLKEHGLFGRYLGRNNMQVFLGQNQKFRERSRMLDNAEDATAGTMPP
jgi:hypothetical protein